jgi:hypothetical protein
MELGVGEACLAGTSDGIAPTFFCSRLLKLFEVVLRLV